jgi:membrane protease YdiL (CAAX protease family)
MTKNIKFILNQVISLSLLPYVVIFTALSFFVSFLLNVVLYLIGIQTEHISTPSLKYSGIFKIILMGVLLAPIIETFIFQKLFFDFLRHKIKVRFIILISALCFGFSHFYDLVYVINTFFIGIILSIAYALWKKKNITPFWIVVIIHLLHNLIILLFQMDI